MVGCLSVFVLFACLFWLWNVVVGLVGMGSESADLVWVFFCFVVFFFSCVLFMLLLSFLFFFIFNVVGLTFFHFFSLAPLSLSPSLYPLSVSYAFLFLFFLSFTFYLLSSAAVFFSRIPELSPCFQPPSPFSLALLFLSSHSSSFLPFLPSPRFLCSFLLLPPPFPPYISPCSSISNSFYIFISPLFPTCNSSSIYLLHSPYLSPLSNSAIPLPSFLYHLPPSCFPPSPPFHLSPAPPSIPPSLIPFPLPLPPPPPPYTCFGRPRTRRVSIVSAIYREHLITNTMK